MSVSVSFQMQAQCYCCENIATTAEHVPPKCLFPKLRDFGQARELRRNLITVPSCARHNTGKSGDDEYLMYVLTMNLSSDALGRLQFSKKVLRAIARRPALATSLLASATPVRAYDPETRSTFPSIAVKGDKRLKLALERVAYGLYRHHFGENWQGGLFLWPEFLYPVEGDDAEKMALTLGDIFSRADKILRTVPFEGENPAVFKYQATRTENRTTLIRMVFYGGCRVLSVFNGAES